MYSLVTFVARLEHRIALKIASRPLWRGVSNAHLLGCQERPSVHFWKAWVLACCSEVTLVAVLGEGTECMQVPAGFHPSQAGLAGVLPVECQQSALTLFWGG